MFSVRMRALSGKLAILVALATSVPTLTFADAKQKLFVGAKEAFGNEQYDRAAAGCWRYLATSSQSAEKYESAQFFLAGALEQLQLYHGAAEYYFQVANTRRNPELLPRAVRALERISLSRPIDEELILRDLIAETDFGSLTQELGDFVFYWQGISNLHRGLHQWASERFARVSRIGYYFFKTLYAASVRLLAPAPKDAQRLAALSFAQLFGALDLATGLESLRRRGESDSPLAFSIKALINEDNQVALRFSELPKGWQMELAMLGFARIAAETTAVLARSRETDEEELGRPFAYSVEIGGIPIYRRAPRFEDRATMIRAVAARRDPVRKLSGRALHALARLLYEQKRYAASYDTLGQVPPRTELSSEILLERAWSKFKAGDAHRAMGLLYALDAPVYRSLFAPEKYVLRGLIYRHFCHFRAAKVAARKFRLHFSQTLRQIRAGVPLAEVERVRAAALRRGDAMRLYLFGRSLRRELERLSQFEDQWKKHGLHRQLRLLYRSKLRQVRVNLRRALEGAAKEIAEQMLRAEEQVNLLEYEVGQAIFDRAEQDGGAALLRKPTPKVPLTSKRVYYRFDDEYWTDELPWYKFNIEDRCVD